VIAIAMMRSGFLTKSEEERREGIFQEGEPFFRHRLFVIERDDGLVRPHLYAIAGWSR
jgi:hypothetical protein